MSGTITRAGLIAAIGQEIGCSDWFGIDQARIDAFADLTEDRQFIHIDPMRAAQTTLGGTVAHGMLTLSMLSAMAQQALPAVTGQSLSINYGYDRVRFVASVRPGARIRGKFTVADAQIRAGDKLMCRFDAVVDIENEKRPALKAEWLVLYIF